MPVRWYEIGVRWDAISHRCPSSRLRQVTARQTGTVAAIFAMNFDPAVRPALREQYLSVASNACITPVRARKAGRIIAWARLRVLRSDIRVIRQRDVADGIESRRLGTHIQLRGNSASASDGGSSRKSTGPSSIQPCFSNNGRRPYQQRFAVIFIKRCRIIPSCFIYCNPDSCSASAA